jgi:hypothetical protein
MSSDDRDQFTALRVRPYLLTGGRTRSAVDLPIEAIVRTTPEGTRRLGGLDHERHRIVTLCMQPQSIAEVSAHLRIHLQVARVLVGDLITEGLISSHATTAPMPNRPDVRLLERVLDGLQSL